MHLLAALNFDQCHLENMLLSIIVFHHCAISSKPLVADPKLWCCTTSGALTKRRSWLPPGAIEFSTLISGTRAFS